MPGRSSFEPLGEPFFTLEYDPESAAFIRKIPEGAEDLKDGRFRCRGRLFRLPESPGGEEAPLRNRTLGGKEILAMARRGYGPLVRSGPVPAERGERLMELALKTAPPGMRRPGPGRGIRRPAAAAASIESSSVTILLVYKIPEEKWLPLEGLPNHRLFQNRIYEIIPDETLASLFSGGPGRYEENGALTLKGEEIPAFADLHARLIYVFADAPLYRLLSQENLFIPREDLSLVLHCAPVTERGIGRATAAPALKYNKKLFSAQALSRRFRSAYIALEDKWVRRETLEQKGMGPLGRYINGESLEPFGIKAGSLFSRDRGELRTGFRGLWEDFEFDRDRWRRYGSEKEIFSAHLEFLRAWGISGGIVSGDREKTAAFLAAWLKSLAAGLERTAQDPGDLFDAPLSGRVLVLTQPGFWGKWLEKELPQSGDGPRTVPAGKYPGASSLGDPRFRGIGLGFYRDFLKARGGEAGWDMLILVGPEEALYNGESFDRDLFRALAAIKTRLRLGVFFSAGFLSSVFPGSKEFSQNPHQNPHIKEIKSFFGLRGNLGEIEKYLVRETGDLLSPPPVKPRPPPAILRPPSPWGDKAPMGDEAFFIIGGGRFFTETKFRGLRSAEYRTEQECFFQRGTSTNEPSVRGPGGGFRERKRRPQKSPPEQAEPDFNHLSPEDREWFFWWRSEFREGRNRETSLAFLLLYTRELVLLMGGRPEEAFEELRRLWKVYREIYPSLDGRFPTWLLDFAILYKTGEKTISPALLGFPPQKAGLVGDLYLHKKYIEENNSLVTADFEDLLPGGRSRAFSRLDFSAGLRERAKDAFGVILNTIDRFLLRNYGKKLLEFFYPLPPRKETITAFEGLAGLGNSAYTAEWLSFSAHGPFLSFLSSIAALLEYRLLKENGFDRPGSPPRLDPLWKYLAGLDDPGDPIPGELGLPQVELEKEKITRLREESDAVRDLLHIEKEEEIPPSPFPTPNSSLLTPNSSLHTFLEELSDLERATLKLIAGGGGRKDLEALAREKGTMADLILDGINGRFMEDRGDLLLEISPDEEPRIQAEYRDEVLQQLKMSNGAARGRV